MTSELSKIYWVRGCDEGLDYCADCAEIVAKDARKAHPEIADEIVIDGGMDIYETDGPAACYRCGHMLACDVIGGPTILTAEEWNRAE